MTTNVMELLAIGKVVDFSTFATITSNIYRSVKVVGILDAASAIALGLDAPAMHAKVFPTLPEGSINDYRKYPYVRIQHPNGSYESIGIPWIVPATIVVKQSSVITAVFEGVGPGDVEKIRQMAALNGYSPTITIE